MVFTNNELFEACAEARAPGLTFEIYAQVWDALCRWIHHTVDECGQGVNIPHFIKVTWAGSQYKDGGASTASSPSKRGLLSAAHGYMRRPHVLVHEAFLRQYDVKFRRPAELPEAKCEEIHFIKVAIMYGQTNGRQKLSKDLVSSALKRMVSKIGEMFQARADIEISFAVGRLFGRNGQAAFLMESKYVPEGVDMRSAAQGNPFNPLPMLPQHGRRSMGSGCTPRTVGGRSVGGRSLASRGASECAHRVIPSTPSTLRMLVVNKKEGQETSLKSNVNLPPMADSNDAAPGSQDPPPHAPHASKSRDADDKPRPPRPSTGVVGGDTGSTFLLTAVPETQGGEREGAERRREREGTNGSKLRPASQGGGGKKALATPRSEVSFHAQGIIQPSGAAAVRHAGVCVSNKKMIMICK